REAARSWRTRPQPARRWPRVPEPATRIGSLAPEELALGRQHVRLFLPGRELPPFPIHHRRRCARNELLVGELALLPRDELGQPRVLGAEPPAFPSEIDGISQRNEDGRPVRQHRVAAGPLIGWLERERRNPGQPLDGGALLLETTPC